MVELGYFPEAFLASLPKLGYGMAGVFLVMVLIMGSLYALNAIFRKKGQ